MAVPDPLSEHSEAFGYDHNGISEWFNKDRQGPGRLGLARLGLDRLYIVPALNERTAPETGGVEFSARPGFGGPGGGF